MDRGHCAPPSGGRLIKGTGHWKFEASNLELSMILGDDGRRRCRVVLCGYSTRSDNSCRAPPFTSWDVQNLVNNEIFTPSHGRQISFSHGVSQTLRISEPLTSIQR